MPIFNRVKEIVRKIVFAASPRLYGRSSSGAGDGEEISIGSGLTLTGGVLSATAAVWSEITGKPATFTPSAHTHPISDVTNLQTSLNGKANTTHTHATVDIVNGAFTAKIRNLLESEDTFDLPKNPSGAVISTTGREDGKTDYVKDGTISGCSLSACNIGADCSFNLPQSVSVPAFADMIIQKTSNTQLTFKLKGTDGVTRSGSITLS